MYACVLFEQLVGQGDGVDGERRTRAWIANEGAKAHFTLDLRDVRSLRFRGCLKRDISGIDISVTCLCNGLEC